MTLKDKLELIVNEGSDIASLTNAEVKELLDIAGKLLTADQTGHARVNAARTALVTPKYGVLHADTLGIEFSEDWHGWCTIALHHLQQK